MDSRLIKPKSLLLKDYLLDDFSSCSSNGFKSFPRRQCCTTVRFLLEIDLKKNKQKKYLNFNKKNPPTIVKNKSKSPLSAFQSVITAVKRLPFAAVSSPEKKKFKNSFLPRSFSKKLLESGFWKRKSNRKEIQRWKSFDELLKEDSSQPLDRFNNSMTSESKSNSWSGSDFTVSTDESSSGNSSSEVNLNLPEGRNDDVEVSRKEVVSSKTVVVTNGDVLRNSTTSTSSDGSSSTNSSTNTKQKEWSNEEKEQFSPVSVLDCPFDDEDEISSSPFQHRLARMEGTKKKLMKKIQRFECLANELEPVNLSKRFVLQPQTDSDNESNGSPLPLSIDDKFISDMEEEEEEEMAFELLRQMKNTLPSYGLKLNAENLLLDFFREKIVERKVASPKQWPGGCSFDEEAIDEAEEWINGRKRSELLLGWEVQKNRQVYIKEMEKGKLEWKTLDQENEEVALELETEVFATLLDEVLLEVMPKFTRS
ncbi:hypothetical protein ACJIZ3_004023 [Penstemon smallii]|uniref:DUF4378 domain-containing protein n=1 Tax=Penstemon smallii TaxID=265156 RepID=A0ABD3S0X6_9LAMI